MTYSIVVSQVTNDDDTWQCTICTMVVVHIEDALEAGYNVCVVISNVSDVIVALLYHMQIFMNPGYDQE